MDNENIKLIDYNIGYIDSAQKFSFGDFIARDFFLNRVNMNR